MAIRFQMDGKTIDESTDISHLKDRWNKGNARIMMNQIRELPEAIREPVFMGLAKELESKGGAM